MVALGISATPSLCRSLVSSEKLLVLLELKLSRLLHHGSLLVLAHSTIRLIELLLLLLGLSRALSFPLVFEDNAGIDVVPIDSCTCGWHTLRLVLFSEVVSKVSTSGIALRVLACFPELGALDLLVVDLDLFLLLAPQHLGIVAVVLLLSELVLRI